MILYINIKEMYLLRWFKKVTELKSQLTKTLKP